MSSASFTVTVDRPVEEVQAYVADLRHVPDWFSMVDRVELLGGEAGEVGARYAVTTERAVFDDTVMDYRTADVAPGRVVFAVDHPKLEGTDTYELRPDGAGTEVTYTTDVGMKKLNKLATPLVGPSLKVAAKAAGPKLKAAIESS